MPPVRDELRKRPRARKAGSGPTVWMYFRGIPPALREAFQAACVLAKVPMREKVIGLMRRTIKETGNPAKAPPAKPLSGEGDGRGSRGGLQISNVPTSLRDHFLAWCVLRGITMQEKMASLMRGFVREEGAKK